MILVTGANGAFGRRTVEYLLERMPAAELAVTVRDAGNAARLAGQGVEVRVADYDQPETLARAYRGASTILLNATNYGAAVAGRMPQQQAAAIRAAAAAGAKRIVVCSWQDLDHCPLPYTAGFRETERLARSVFDSATILRFTYGMAASVARDVQAAVASGMLAAPAGDARIAPAATDDLALAAATVLADPGHDGRTYHLTGPAAIGWTDLASLASALVGHPVSYQPVSNEEFRAQMSGAGWPGDAIEMLIEYYAAFRSGWAGALASDLSQLLGRPAAQPLDAVRAALPPVAGYHVSPAPSRPS